MSHSNNNKVTVGSLLIALGIIYGDIGTSPLYVMKSVVGNHAIDKQLIFGAVSCIFWTLFFQTTVKYVWLTLKADNQGEGGIFSLYALVKRYSKKLVIPTIIGSCALLADGIITPPISVSSAVEGLDNLPGLAHIPTVPIVIAILSIIFFFQRYGTHKVGTIFGPYMFGWFSMLLVLGLYQVVKEPKVIEALNPIYAFDLLVHRPHGFWILGAIFLCTTGAESLYSDLGHCGRKNIRITWIYVKICLIVNYLGQASWALQNDHLVLKGRNPFFEMMPEWFLIPGIIISTFAAIIASQALITGSFTLINEAMNLNFWPRVAVRQPSESKGQIYIPGINLILWVGCILMILYFKDSAHMEAAYGLAITITMLMTTLLLAYFLYIKLKWNAFAVIGMILIFVTIEMSFFIANLVKFKEGGYITVLIAGIFFVIMYTTYFGRKITTKFTNFVELGKYTPMLKELSEDKSVNKFATFLIYLTKSDRRTEIEDRIIKSIFAKRPKRADVYWFVHLNRTNQPYTLNYEVSELVEEKLFKITINVGFRLQPKTEAYFKIIVKDLLDSGELKLKYLTDNSKKYNLEPDIRFIVLERFLSVENEFSFHDSLVLNLYFFMKPFSMSDQKAFGLEKSDVIMEQTPLLYQPAYITGLKRIHSQYHRDNNF